VEGESRHEDQILGDDLVLFNNTRLLFYPLPVMLYEQ
jgi:hypothetical protein